MGLFDKIKDNAKSVSLKALDEAENIDEKAKNTEDSTQSASRPEPKATEHERATVETRPEPAHAPASHDHFKVQEEVGRIPTRAATSGASYDAVKKVERTKAEEVDKPAVAAPVAAPPRPAPRPQPQPEPAASEPAADEPEEPEEDEDEEEVELEEANETTSRRSENTLASLAAQLQMSGSEPVFSTEHMNFRTKVYINRVEYMGSFGKIVIPVNKIGWIKIRVAGTGIIVETTNSKRVVMIVKPKDRIRLCDAIMRVQEINIERGKSAAVRGTSATDLERLSISIEELEKLAKLKEKGIITEKEFVAKKKQLLGV